jgi:hypothetical protein
VTVRAAAIVLLPLTFAGLLGCQATAGESPRVNGHCLGFPGEQIDAVAWSPDGTTVAVASDVIADGTTVIRSVAWPDLTTIELARDPAISNMSVGAGTDGEVTWIREDDGRAVIEAASASSPIARPIMTLPTPAVFNHRRTSDGIALNMDSRDVAEVVRVREADGSIDVAFETADLIDSFGMTFDGRTVAIHHFPEVGKSGAVTTVIDGEKREYGVTASGIAHLTLSGSGKALLYVDVATGSLVMSSLEFSNPIRLREGATAGELSPLNILAWIPAPVDSLEVRACLEALA